MIDKFRQVRCSAIVGCKWNSGYYYFYYFLYIPLFMFYIPKIY
jgi:hypothetical protein